MTKYKYQTKQFTMHINETYPIIRIPKKLTEILNLSPDNLEFPSQPNKPNKPPEEDSHSRLLGIGSIVMFFSLIIIGGLNSNQSNSENSGIGFFVLLTIIGLIILIIGFNRQSEDKKKNKINKEKYDRKLNEHNEELYRFYEKRDEYYKLKDLLKNKNFRKQHIQNEIREYFAQNQYVADKWGKTVQKGPGEQYMIKALQKYHFVAYMTNHYIRDLEEEFFDEHLMHPSVLERKKKSNKYIADILYEDLNTGILIDIEIDEPYVFSTKEPIHYNNSDKKRDDFMLNRDCIVIRFSEKQVFTQPDSCVKVIAKLLYECGSEIDLGQFSEIDDVGPDPIWSYSDAQNMANKNYRKQYRKP